MKTCMTLGPTPPRESCTQVGAPDYEERARFECKTYIGVLRRWLTACGIAIPEGFRLVTQGHPHDFGTYYEVGVEFDDDDRASHELASLLEGDSPADWDQEARDQLAEKGGSCDAATVEPG